ncbi:hypothetical protein HID58_020192, partial [Brassica napus]
HNHQTVIIHGGWYGLPSRKSDLGSGASVQGASALNIRATYHFYNPEQNNWDLMAVTRACLLLHCVGMAGPPSADRLVLRVRNVMTNAVVTVRIVDLFKRLDNDGVGYGQGQLIVDYEFVDCDDELINQPVFFGLHGIFIEKADADALLLRLLLGEARGVVAAVLTSRSAGVETENVLPNPTRDKLLGDSRCFNGG